MSQGLLKEKAKDGWTGCEGDHNSKQDDIIANHVFRDEHEIVHSIEARLRDGICIHEDRIYLYKYTAYKLRLHDLATLASYSSVLPVLEIVKSSHIACASTRIAPWPSPQL